MGCRELKSGWGTGPKWESQEAVGTGGAGANQEDDFLGREDGEGSLLTGNAKVCLVMEIQRQATQSAEVWAAGKESREQAGCCGGQSLFLVFPQLPRCRFCDVTHGRLTCATESKLYLNQNGTRNKAPERYGETAEGCSQPVGENPRRACTEQDSQTKMEGRPNISENTEEPVAISRARQWG